MRRATVLFISCALLPLAGCPGGQDYSKPLTQFSTAATTLDQSFQTFVNNANLIEENHYIDEQTFAKSGIHPVAIAQVDVLTPEEIKMRTSAIKALTDYTTALASLASGQPAAKIEADAKTTSGDLKTLTSDSEKAMLHPSPKSKTADYATPISAAVSAIGEVISLFEKHRGLEEVKASLDKNDPNVTELFNLLSQESADLYARQKSDLDATGDQLYEDYNTMRQQAGVNSTDLLQLSDRIKELRKEEEALPATDPSKAIAAFKTAHDALIKAIQAPKSEKKEKMSDLFQSVQQFAKEVSPLATDLQTMGSSLK